MNAPRLRLRQVALVAHDLAAAEADIERLLGLEMCFRDPGVAAFGLHNALYPVGDKLLEVVSPTTGGTTAGRLLDKRGGDGGYMVIFQTDDLDDARSRFDSSGARVVFEAVAEGVVGLHLHPRDVGGAIVSVDETDEWAEWPWAGPHWQRHARPDRVTDLVAVEIHADDPAAMAARWAEVVGGRLDGTRLRFDEGEVRFTHAGERGEGVAAVDLTGTADEGAEHVICGTTIRVLPAPPA